MVEQGVVATIMCVEWTVGLVGLLGSHTHLCAKELNGMQERLAKKLGWIIGDHSD